MLQSNKNKKELKPFKFKKVKREKIQEMYDKIINKEDINYEEYRSLMKINYKQFDYLFNALMKNKVFTENWLNFLMIETTRISSPFEIFDISMKISEYTVELANKKGIKRPVPIPFFSSEGVETYIIDCEDANRIMILDKEELEKVNHIKINAK